MQQVTYENKQGYLDENTKQFYPKEAFQEVTYEGKKGVYHPESKQFFPVEEVAPVTTLPKPVSPWENWYKIQKESAEKALKVGANIATGLIPPLNFLRPSWREEYKKAPSAVGLPPGTLTGGEFTPEEIARIGAEGKTKESMLGEVTGATLENLALMAPGGPVEKGITEGAKLVGRVIPPLARTVGKVIPESFKKTARGVFESIKAPFEVEKGAVAGLRKGAERSIGELSNIEKQLYDQARAGTSKEILQGKKVVFDNTTKGMNTFEETETFGRLHPPEAEEIRRSMRQVAREISPEARTGKTRMSREEMQDIIETGTGEFLEGAGEVKLPGTFTQARATRSWLSKEAFNASKKGNKNLSNAYRGLKDMLELDIENAVGSDAWTGWKAADSFKTRKGIMDEVFGKGKIKRGTEIKPGKYEFAQVKKNIKEISPQRFEAAGFSKGDIQALYQISDVGKFRTYVETHPLLKVVIPLEAANELLGLKFPVPSVTRAGRYILGRAIGI